MLKKYLTYAFFLGHCQSGNKFWNIMDLLYCSDQWNLLLLSGLETGRPAGSIGRNHGI